MFKLDDCVAYIATNALKKVSDSLNDLLIRHGSTRVQWIAMYYICKTENINQSELSKLMNIKTPTIVRLIDRLEREGLVRRSIDPQNRRVVRLSCTKKGQTINKDLMPLADAFSTAITDGISEEELDTFKAVLVKLEANSSGTDQLK